MYAFVDQPLGTTPEGCRFLVWSMRTWVATAAQRGCPGQALAPAFARLNMLSGLQPFLRTMAALNRYGLEQMRFCSANCRHVSEHEAILVSLACLVAAGRGIEAAPAMAMLVEEEAAGTLFESLDALVRAMAVADLALPSPMSSAPLD